MYQRESQTFLEFNTIVKGAIIITATTTAITPINNCKKIASNKRERKLTVCKEEKVGIENSYQREQQQQQLSQQKNCQKKYSVSEIATKSNGTKRNVIINNIKEERAGSYYNNNFLKQSDVIINNIKQRI